MSIVITPNVPPLAPQGATTADIILQSGSVISARVVQLLGNDQVRIAIGGQSIDVTSLVPLQAGQTLQLQVSQTASGIRLAVVNQQAGADASQGFSGASAVLDSLTVAPDLATGIAPPATPGPIATSPQLTALETLAVAVAAQSAATQQTSLAPLFANLDVAAGLAGLPPQIQQAAAQLLAQRTSLDQNLTCSDIKQALQASGLFLEASLASGSVASSTATPDIKAALIVLRQVLTTALAGVTAAGTQAAAGTPLATPTAQPGAAPLTAPQGAVQVAIIAAQNAALSETIAATPLSQATISGAPAPPQPPSVQPSPQPVVVAANSETGVTLSPTLAPSLAPAAFAPATSAGSTPGTAPAFTAEIIDLGVTSQILPPAVALADAGARAAASNAALNLLQGTLQAGPLAAGNLSKLVLENGQLLSLLPVVTAARTPAIDDAEFARTNLPPPPITGGLPAAQPVVPATLVPHAPVEATLQHLLTDTDGALARQTLLQVASLPGQTDAAAGRLDPPAPRWNFEIPFATVQGTAIAQFEISRDGGREAGAATQVWRARFSLDVEPSGPIHALISLSGERTSVRMWAERPATAAQLRAGISQLSAALSSAELQPGDIIVRDGAPPPPAAAPAGHFLDRAL